MSTGYLPGAHNESCPVYKKVLKQKPKWMFQQAGLAKKSR